MMRMRRLMLMAWPLASLTCAGCLGVLCLAAALPAEEPGKAPATATAAKPMTRSFRIESVDAKALRLAVKEEGHELVWHATRTRFFHHRSIPLKDVPDGSTVHVLGKLHEPRNDTTGKTGKRTDPMLTNIEHIGVGAAHVEPPLVSPVAGVAWAAGKLSTRQNRYFENGGERYRMVVDEKTAAYSLERLKPEDLAGKKVIVRANPRKVTVERDGKTVTLTRLNVLEVHLVELGPEHAKVFQMQWVERKKKASAPPPAKK
jgi:hypothetical protein